jgi:hypothetical protein
MDRVSGEPSKNERLDALKGTAGAWSGRKKTGAKYVEALRNGDLKDRLAKLGLRRSHPGQRWPGLEQVGRNRRHLAMPALRQ